MDFLEITRQFEEKIKSEFDFELLELHYVPYAFGSGTKSYKIKGKNVQIIFDGRDGIIEMKISGRHEKYNNSNWTNVFAGTSSDFVDKGVGELRKQIKDW